MHIHFYRCVFIRSQSLFGLLIGLLAVFSTSFSLIACQSRNLNSTQLKEIRQTAHRLTDEQGNTWTRHVVAVQGFSRYQNSTVLELVQAGIDLRTLNPDSDEDLKIQQATLSRRPARNPAELAYSNGQINLFHDITLRANQSQGTKKFALGGASDLYFLGCLIMQKSNETYSDTLSVPRFPKESGFGPEKIDLTIRDVRWLWELMPDAVPRDIHSYYGVKRAENLSEKFRNLWYTANLKVEDYSYSLQDYTKFTESKLKKQNLSEQNMLSQYYRNKSQEGYTCRILLGPVDSYEEFVTFGIEELIQFDEMASNIHSLKVNYMNDFRQFQSQSGQWFGKNWPSLVSVGLFGLSYFGSENTIAAIPIILGRIAANASPIKAVIGSASALLKEKNEHSARISAQESKRLRSVQSISVPEHLHLLALTESILSSTQEAAFFDYSAQVISLLKSDLTLAQNKQNFPLASAIIASIPNENLLRFTQLYDSRQETDPMWVLNAQTSNADLTQEQFEQIRMALIAFASHYKTTAVMSMNRSFSRVFNHLSVGSETTGTQFDRFLAAQTQSPSSAQELLRMWKNENLLELFWQLQSRSRAGTYLSDVHIAKMMGPSPIAPESYPSQVKIAGLAQLLRTMLNARKLNTDEEAKIYQNFIAGLAKNAQAGNENTDGQLRSLGFEERISQITNSRLTFEHNSTFVTNALERKKRDQGALRTCDADGNDCFDFFTMKSMAQQASQTLFNLDSMAQTQSLGNFENCAKELGNQTCENLRSKMTAFEDYSQGLLQLCSDIQEASEGLIKCSNSPTAEALIHFEHLCTQAKKESETRNNQCIERIRDNSPSSSESGYWPALPLKQISPEFVSNESKRVLANSNLALSQTEKSALIRLQELLL